jgi:hypothetical protein
MRLFHHAFLVKLASVTPEGLAEPGIGDVVHRDTGHAMPVPRCRAHGVQFRFVGGAAQARERALRKHWCAVQAHARPPHPGWK